MDCVLLFSCCRIECQDPDKRRVTDSYCGFYFQIFYPETTDVYDRKNMPKVVYCIHALR